MSRRVALVTGGTRGIGLGIARALAREHWTLALCGMRPEADVRATLDDLKADGAPEVAYWPADIGDRLARERLVTGIEARFASLDALVNNAGKAPAVRAPKDVATPRLERDFRRLAPLELPLVAVIHFLDDERNPADGGFGEAELQLGMAFQSAEVEHVDERVEERCGAVA